MLGTLTRESLVLVNENTSHPPPLHVRGTRVRFYGKRKRRRGCNERVEEEEEIKEEEEELDFIDRKILWNSMILVSLV